MRFLPQADHFNPKKEPNQGVFSDALASARNEHSKIATAANSYIVKSGDSLYRIAQRLKTSLDLPQSLTTLVNEMSSLNHLSDPDRIFPGQQLHLPAVSPSKAPLNLTRERALGEVLASVTHVISTSQPQAAITASPQATTMPDQKFPLFVQRGSIVLPAETPAAYFTRQDFPTADHPRSDAKIRETNAVLTVPDKCSTASPLDKTGAGEAKPHTQLAIYKEDQLLAHPGGDYYFLNRDQDIRDPFFDQSRFVHRVGKDLADTGANLLNIAKNLAWGAQYKYVAENGEIQSGQRVGLLGTLKNFVEDVCSGLSFGAYVPDGETAPEGASASVGYFFKKIFYDAPIKDLLIGIPHAAVNMINDTALASINLLEVIPDATIGNFEWGQKATTTIFDNSQVAIDYLTDVLPGGDAWLRVHAAGPRGNIEPPIYFNLMTNEQGISDSRWATVRNTPFRKTIETLGSLLSDAAIVAITAHSYSPSSDQRHD